MDEFEFEEHSSAAAVLINRPFLFRLLHAESFEPILVGFITCPNESEIKHVSQCLDIRRNCEKHEFCSRLDDICNLWNHCTE